MSEIHSEEITVRHVRPRFYVLTDKTPKELADQINEALKSPEAKVKGKAYEQFWSFSLPEEEQHYWSPRLKVTVDTSPEGTEVRGLYGPRSSVWTMFVFFYSSIGFSIVVIAMLGMSYLTLDKPAGILWAVPVLILMFFSLYLVAYMGKKKGYDQMVKLHQCVEKATGLSLEETL